jgi:hypothetical protein
MLDPSWYSAKNTPKARDMESSNFWSIAEPIKCIDAREEADKAKDIQARSWPGSAMWQEKIRVIYHGKVYRSTRAETEHHTRSELALALSGNPRR